MRIMIDFLICHNQVHNRGKKRKKEKELVTICFNVVENVIKRFSQNPFSIPNCINYVRQLAAGPIMEDFLIGFKISALVEHIATDN